MKLVTFTTQDSPDQVGVLVNNDQHVVNVNRGRAGPAGSCAACKP